MSPPVTEIATGRPAQLVLELSAPPATAETPLVPVRMVNEFVYCPRLAFLEWVDGEWADSGDTEEGRRAHVRVDSGGGKLPAPDAIDVKPDFAALGDTGIGCARNYRQDGPRRRRPWHRHTGRHEKGQAAARR